MAAANIQVAIKVRPLFKKESKFTSHWKIVDNSIQLIDSQSDPFYFDHIFDEDATNENIFDVMGKPIVHAALRGFNGTIFAYGQTSSGKTYTMLGDDRNPGVMIRAVQEIFREIENATDRAFLIRVGYIEIYNEKIYDLLDKNNKDLKIHEPQSGEVTVNCTYYIIRCEKELLSYLQNGNKTRRIGETAMNERSSRSHAIFRIIIESREFDKPSDETAVQISHLNLVDLAGSERADQSGATGTRLKEGGHINKSLLSLSLVIKKLSGENESDKYINYRDSKLTRMLQASLGGNALTAIICTIKLTTIEETNSTLSFAMSAKSIKNKPHKNEILSDSAMMKRLAKEISRLQNELEVEKSKNSKIKVSQLERKIKDFELNIVHSHAVFAQKHPTRRRTWCPSSSHPEVASESPAENGNEEITTDFPNKAKMLMTPLITMRDYQQNNEIKEEMFIPADEVQFALIDDRDAKDLHTPTKNVKFAGKFSLTPINDIRTKYQLLETELEELKIFTSLEKDAELCEAKEKISELEKERLQLLDLRDRKYESEIKLERSQQRCVELESRISELDDRINFLERQQDTYQIDIEDSQQKIKSLQMASRDITSLEYEFEKQKEILKLREEELLGILSQRDERINCLEKQLGESLQSQDAAVIPVSCNKSSLPDYGEGEHINQNAKTNSNSRLNNSENISENNITQCSEATKKSVEDVLENLKRQLDTYKDTLTEKEQVLKNLQLEIQEMKLQNNKMEEANNELSDQMMDYLYENEALLGKIKEYEVSFRQTESVNKELQAKIEKLEKILKSSSNIGGKRFSLMESPEYMSGVNGIGFDSKRRFETIPEETTLYEIAQSVVESIIDSLPISDASATNCKNSYTSNAPQINSTDSNTNNGIVMQKYDSVEEFNSELKEQINNYEALNNELRNRVDALSSNLTTSESSNAEFRNSIQELELFKSNLQEKLNEAQNRIRELEAMHVNDEHEHEQQEPEVVQAEMSKLQVELEKLKADMMVLENERIDHKRLENKLNDEIIETRSQLKELLQQKTDWEAIILQSGEDIAKFKEQVKELENELIQTRSEKEATNEKLFRVEERRSEFKETIDGHIQKISSLEQQNAELFESLKDFENLKIELKKQEELIDLGKKELHEKDIKLIGIESDYAENIRTLQEEKEKHEQLVNEKIKNIEELESQIQNLSDAQNKLVETLQIATSEKAESDKEIIELTQKIKVLVHSEKELQQALEESKKFISQYENNTESIKLSKTELENQLKDYLESNQKLTSEISLLKDEKLELQEQLAELKSSLLSAEIVKKELDEKIEKLSTDRKNLTETKTKLEKQLEGNHNEINDLRNLNETLNNDTEEMKKALEILQQSLQRYDEDLISLKYTLQQSEDTASKLQEERDNLLEIKQQLEIEFQRKLREECELTVAELTNVRSQNLVLTDKVETLIAEKNDIEALLNMNVARTKRLEEEVNMLNEKLDNSHAIKMDLENKISHAISENERLNTRILDYENTIADLEKEIKRLRSEHDQTSAKQQEQIEKAKSKLSGLKSELETQLQQFNKLRIENEELKQEQASKKDVICVNDSTEKEEILKQLHEMQRMHIYKTKQYQQEIQKLRTQLTDLTPKNDVGGKCKSNLEEAEKQRIIKALLGENDELRIKNQTLTDELQESRRISQKDRKTKRYSNHDETRSLSLCDSREIGTMTVITDKFCNCEQLDKELMDVKKALLIKNCQINVLRMESEHHPLKQECEKLKKAVEEEEAEKREMRKELHKLRIKISELYKETKKCDNCDRRSKTAFTNQFSQTAFEEPSNYADYSKLESDHSRLLHKYDDLKRLCRLRNTRIQDLEARIAKKEIEVNSHIETRGINTEDQKLNSLIKELEMYKKKYDEAKQIVGFREKHIQSLEAKLSQVKPSFHNI